MMIEPFSWENWKQVYLHKKNKKRVSLERYGLRSLHSVASLDLIVSKVHELYLKKQQEVAVNAKSVWIDGTPQAKFKSVDGSVLNCELADLLFIIHEMDNKNKTINFRATLLQGKCSEKHNLLPNGPSTDKERKLLESIDRNEYLYLYPGTRAYGEKIGKYKLGGENIGLADCAKYLIMPKYERWKYKTPDNISPYVIGWPNKISSNYLTNVVNYMDVILEKMISSKTMGKEINLTMQNHIDRQCEWSKMIYDLLNSYLPITMKGYDSQRRVYKSSLFDDNMSATLALINNGHCDFISKHAFKDLPKGKGRFLYQHTLNILGDYSSPVISTIYIQIKQKEGEIYRQSLGVD
ncbi:lysogenic conversion protein [Escherichia coli]|nr:lysogenic conversion protein [Escherichia coli]EGN8023702.1 lysogenic conversion protein [Escherichia coli]EHW0740458.1 lysogenic conversion protein [Escherichia coli]EHY2025656.1 lysogenic conversion protein [Escherichia coli]EJE8000397.1 lysogenic conversion protein [Escherichia coli]